MDSVDHPLNVAVLLVNPDELLPRDLWAWLVRWRSGFRCEDCGKQFSGDGKVKQRETRLHAHHVDLDPQNHRLQNGRAMCGKCHQSLHRKLTPATKDEYHARMKKAWITRKQKGTVNSRFAKMTPEEHSEKAKKGARNRKERKRDSRGRFL